MGRFSDGRLYPVPVQLRAGRPGLGATAGVSKPRVTHFPAHRGDGPVAAAATAAVEPRRAPGSRTVTVPRTRKTPAQRAADKRQAAASGSARAVREQAVREELSALNGPISADDR